MAEAEPGLPDPFIDSILERIRRIASAFSHIARVIDPEVVDSTANPDNLVQEDQQNLSALGRILVASYALLNDLSDGLDIPIEERPAILTAAPKPADDQSVTLTASEDTKTTATWSAPQTDPSQSRERIAIDGDQLYKAIVDASLVPRMDPPRKEQAIEVAIVGRNKIKIGEQQITLKRHDLFLFNALLLLRDQPRTGAELKALGFFSASANISARNATFSRSMKNVMDLLHRAAGIELVSKIGGKAPAMRYCVNPNLVLVDQRDGESEFDEDGNIGEHEVDRPFIILAKRYGQHPQVQRALASLKNGSGVTSPVRYTTKRYLQEINQYGLLGDLEEQQVLFADIEAGLHVFQHWQNGKDLTPEDEQALIKLVIAHHTVYLSNLRMVVRVAKKYTSFNMPLLDLIQEGNIGLAKAIARFEVDRGLKFLSYAVFWIRQQINRAIGDKSRTIRLPIYNHEKWIKLRSQINKLEISLGRLATHQEIADATGKTVKEVIDMLHTGRITLPSLNIPISDSGKELGDLLADELSLHEEDRVVNGNALRKEISNLFLDSDLSRREQFVLSFRYGLDLPELHGIMVDDVKYSDYATYDHSMSFAEIGQAFGVTTNRIRQIEVAAMEKIRLYIINQGLVYAGFSHEA